MHRARPRTPLPGTLQESCRSSRRVRSTPCSPIPPRSPRSLRRTTSRPGLGCRPLDHRVFSGVWMRHRPASLQELDRARRERAVAFGFGALETKVLRDVSRCPRRGRPGATGPWLRSSETFYTSPDARTTNRYCSAVTFTSPLPPVSFPPVPLTPYMLERAGRAGRQGRVHRRGHRPHDDLRRVRGRGPRQAGGWLERGSRRARSSP